MRLRNSLMKACMWVDLIGFCVQAKKLHLSIPVLSEESILKSCSWIERMLNWYVKKASKQLSNGKPPALSLVPLSSTLSSHVRGGGVVGGGSGSGGGGDGTGVCNGSVVSEMK